MTRGYCPCCGSVSVRVIDDGEAIWVECCTCGRTLVGYSPSDCPFSLLYAAERIEGG